MDNILPFKPIKLADPDRPDDRVVFQCGCGCQVFWVLQEGFIQCIACHVATPTVEVF